MSGYIFKTTNSHEGLLLICNYIKHRYLNIVTFTRIKKLKVKPNDLADHSNVHSNIYESIQFIKFSKMLNKSKYLSCKNKLSDTGSARKTWILIRVTFFCSIFKLNY